MNPARDLALASVLLLCLVFGGCGREPGRVAAPANSRTLVLYNWEEYIGSDTVASFETETGIDVQELFFKDEEESMGAVQADLAAYDLVVFSDDLVREMRRAKILAPLDKSKIPNLKNLGKRFLHSSIDPELKYSVPYLWGSTGMVINKKYIREDRDGWKVLFDSRYKGKIAMLFNPYDVLAAGCKLLGYSLNTQDPRELARVRDLLLAQKKILKGYLDYGAIMELLESEELWAGQIYSGEGMQLMTDNENLQFVIPKEGAGLWLDTFVIPRDAKHKVEAHQFLNYILKPEVNAAIASELWYATANEKAGAFMDPEVLKSSEVYPTPEVLARCEYFATPDEAVPIIMSIWEELQE